ncbi:hypothetical protein JTB14_024593 [Gonioctena quinquepunctata]|nr:hypothetical protein JTB14_024593 [Gonioctena quinquepunctata]
MATKAVHLALVSALSTEAFLLTLKRFISRRGIPAVIHSDNATNYVGARNHLRELREFFDKSQLSESLKVFAAETGFDWKALPKLDLPVSFTICWMVAVKDCTYIELTKWFRVLF